VDSFNIISILFISISHYFVQINPKHYLKSTVLTNTVIFCIFHLVGVISNKMHSKYPCHCNYYSLKVFHYFTLLHELQHIYFILISCFNIRIIDKLFRGIHIVCATKTINELHLLFYFAT